MLESGDPLCKEETNRTEIFLDNIFISSTKESTGLVILPPSGSLRKWEKGNAMDPTPISVVIMHAQIPKSS